MMRNPKAGTNNIPLMLTLFCLSLLFMNSVPASAASQYLLDCKSCHGMPPLDSPARDPLTGGFQGNHQTHLSASAHVFSATADRNICVT